MFSEEVYRLVPRELNIGKNTIFQYIKFNKMFLSVDLFVQTLKLTIKITVPCINIGKDLKHTYYKYTCTRDK